MEPTTLTKPDPPPRALVAEDDPQMRRLVADLVRREGFVVEEIKDGKQLLLRVVEAFLPLRGAAPFDLVVSDVRMPFCSGLEVLRELRGAQHATPVVLMSAFGEATLRTEIELLDARLLDKPFTPAALRAAVRAAIEGPDTWRGGSPDVEPSPTSGE
jgi:DNA-binding response OmpR family regulator